MTPSITPAVTLGTVEPARRCSGSRRGGIDGRVRPGRAWRPVQGRSLLGLADFPVAQHGLRGRSRSHGGTARCWAGLRPLLLPHLPRPDARWSRDPLALTRGGLIALDAKVGSRDRTLRLSAPGGRLLSRAATGRPDPQGGRWAAEGGGSQIRQARWWTSHPRETGAGIVIVQQWEPSSPGGAAPLPNFLDGPAAVPAPSPLAKRRSR